MIPNEYFFMYKLYEKNVLAQVDLKTIFITLVGRNIVFKSTRARTIYSLHSETISFSKSLTL
jgi:hypothetical protein